MKSNKHISKDQLPNNQLVKGLHPNNRHHGRYDLPLLVKKEPQLANYLKLSPTGNQTIDFSEPEAVKLLNKAILAADYKIKFWDIPVGYLCPPIPGRADYIHRLASLINPEGVKQKITALDIGTGASCIYPIIGTTEYNWHWVATDIDPISIKTAQFIVKSNKPLNNKIECRLQTNAKQIFNGIIKKGDKFDVTVCNPPFHKSLADATKGTQRKIDNLSANRNKKGLTETKKSTSQLNFGGQKAELWCDGGEEAFIINMAKESRDYGSQCRWFSTLISKKENVKQLETQLKRLKVTQIHHEEMKQGNKVTRFVAWSFQ
ncbi:23S rRNA (adenine(1618)-N(6))-methyltransferase RlmF [Vibrio sp. SS-MA-C1-2]|uniref:23S rRNA (adenine(1618)-N(6))-methyltransferase RlmF n=1 Tax=Vibrio sp. SS-MA-C1-2 TaxID=2908646 RepID=UPI001F34ACE9|nr:23S rRNA (adenine(1618)-N(6))-methyltransferase RlmF [Vibrio sp. SS-MA-C1-2]UJF18327.1 23S rRNA (adenine(1618)-N(6))-methyltransferase RlmF [Vibrio sp. SS-MA-C1-2]